MIGVIIPDRGDRPKFLANCKRMIAAQSIAPDQIILVSDKPINKVPDLTKRIREGFEFAKDIGCDVILIMENDDFYHVDYIATMLKEWKIAGRPDIFGTSSTVYYHVLKRQFKKLDHPKRASLMNTLIKCDAQINWPNDEEIFLDLNIWKQLKGKTFEPGFMISMGIKHGQGLCGGRGHSSMIYNNDDPNWEYLKNNIDPESFEFYYSIALELK
jgi:hypothetical protein